MAGPREDKVCRVSAREARPRLEHTAWALPWARNGAGVDAGWAHEHAELPFWPLRCDPYSVVDESERAGKPKFRLTNDHSWPPPHALDGTLLDEGGRWAPSLNHSMDRAAWPEVKYMRVAQMAEAAAILQSSGARVRVVRWGQ